MTRPFQFSLEKLLLLITWVAILCVVGPLVVRWGGISRKYWPITLIATWMAAVWISPQVFFAVRAYRRFRDSDL